MNKLKKMRGEKGLKQAELAEMLGVSQATLSNWERGVHDPDTAQLKELSRIFSVSTDFLLGHEPVIASEDQADQVYFRIAQDAKKSGISAHDLQMAINFLKMARDRDNDV